MNTGSIAYRIADFLRKSPPFQFVSEEDLMGLAQGARVRFHEKDEYVFEEGKRRGNFLYVINKGIVRLIQKTGATETTHDFRGEGDLVGLGFFANQESYRHSAKTDSECLLYALKLDALQQLLPKYPEVVRWFGAYFSLNPNAPVVRRITEFANSGTRKWLNERALLPDWIGRKVGYCYHFESVAQAAQTLAFYEASALAVVTAEMQPLGMISNEVLRNLIATGNWSPEDPVENHISRNLVVAPKDLSIGDYILLMMRHGSADLCLTEDGTAESRLIRCLSHEDLLFAYGTDPVLIVEEIRCSDNDEERHSLRRLRERAEAYIAAALAGRESVEWFAKVNATFTESVAERVLTLSTRNLVKKNGHYPPLEKTTLVMAGRAARQEFFGVRGTKWLLLINERPERFGLSVRQDWQGEFEVEWERCGFTSTYADHEMPYNMRCQTVDEWLVQLKTWIREPENNHVWAMREWLDLESCVGPVGMPEVIPDALRRELAESDRFFRYYAAQILSHRVPMTIFRDEVIEDAGIGRSSIDLRKELLLPMVDSARLLSFAIGETRTLSTADRLRLCADKFRKDRALFEEAVEAFLLVFYLQSRTLLLEEREETVVRVSELTRIDQHLLKSAMRSAESLLDFLAKHFCITRTV